MQYHIEYSKMGFWTNAVGTFTDIRQGSYDTLGMAQKDMYFAASNNPSYTFRIVTIHEYRINKVSC